MALTALKRQPAEQMAAEALKEAILTGALKPGERLTEVVLAQQFGVSRGTVRIALHQMSLRRASGAETLHRMVSRRLRAS